MNAANPRQLLVDLQPGQHGALIDEGRPGEFIAQASRVGDVYYLVGPHFAERCTLKLATYFLAAAKNQWEPAAAVALLNTKLQEQSVPPEARIFRCTGLPDALQTLAGLFAAYR